MDDQSLPARSTFVTVVAWIFIVLAGFATVIGILQNIMIVVMFPASEMQQVGNQAASAHMPGYASLMFNHVQLIFFLVLLVFAATFVAAVGLLKRKNWARIGFIVLMGLGILWNLAGLIFMFYFMGSTPDMPSDAKSQVFADQFNTMRNTMFAFNLVFVGGFVALFGWIIKRLVSEETRREFTAS